MTRDEVVALIKQVLGFRTTLDATIVSNLKFAQTQLESEPTKPWFMISEDSFTTTTALEERILVPDDFLEEVEEAVLKYVPDDDDEEEVDLVKEDYDTLRNNYRGSADGAPEAYALQGQYFRLFPRPDAIYTIRMIYYQKVDTLDSNIENGWTKYVPFLIAGEAGMIIAASIGNSMAFAVFKEWAAKGRITLATLDVSRDSANRNMQVGGSH